MKRSPTITTSFPAGALQEPFDEDAEERTVVTKRPGAKTAPFGSTLSARPLRARYNSTGVVLLTSGDGSAMSMYQLPEWERRELFRHLRFMSEIGVL